MKIILYLTLNMAKIWIDRAYIEASERYEDEFSITIHSEGILIGKFDLDNPLPWLYTMSNEDNDLVINNSAGMEAKKWDHITKEILGDVVDDGISEK